jgi:hypothetical protein
VDGDITITGQGGTVSGSNSDGVAVWDGGSIASTGVGASAGTITITGTGGSGPGSMDGVMIASNGGTASTVTSVDGDITITGTGGTGTGATDTGVGLQDGGIVSSTGAGAGAANITITGTGGAATGGSNHGVYLNNNNQIVSAGPVAIAITGQAGAVSGDDIKTITGANVIGGAAAGDVTLIGNTMNFANLTASSAEDVILKSRTAATTIGLGGAAGTLNLTGAELDMFDAGGELIIGRPDGTGAIAVDAYANWANIAGTGVQFLSNPNLLPILSLFCSMSLI